MTVASNADLVLAVVSAALGGTLVQAARVRIDRRGSRAIVRAEAYRSMRALLRRYPLGPPQLSGRPHDPKLERAFLDNLAALAGTVAGGWPADGLAYTLERLVDALARLPEHPEAAAGTERLYRVCSAHLVALDLGAAGTRLVGAAAVPLVGPLVRTAREMRARAELGRVMPPIPHGLPLPPASSLGPPADEHDGEPRR